MSTVPRDKARQFALLKAELLAAARAAVEKLTLDQCEVIYVEIEQRLAAAVHDASSVTEPSAEQQVTPAARDTSSVAELNVEQQAMPAAVLPQKAPPVGALPVAVVKRRAAEDVEREYLADLMVQANGSVTDAAKLAGADRSNFRRRLQRAGLRAPGQMKPGPKHTDQIVRILDDNKIGMRTYEIAERTGQKLPNAFRILKFLEKQGRVVRHGKRTSTLWTLPGVVPSPRIETVQAVIVDVLSKGEVPMDSRVLEVRVDRFLREKGRKLKRATFMAEIGRLVEKGVVAFHGANEHGPMFALTVPKGGSELN